MKETKCYTGPGCRLHNPVNNLDTMLADIETRIATNKEKITDQKKDIFPEIEYGSEAYNNFIEYGNSFTKNLSPEEWEEVYMYTTMNFQKINTALKNGETPKATQNLDTALYKSPLFKEPIRVYRGVKNLDRYKEGEVVVFPTYVSTSMSTKVAQDFAGEDGAIITFTTQTGAALNNDTSEHGLAEKEILLPRNLKFRVEKIVKADYQIGYNKKPVKTIYLTIV